MSFINYANQTLRASAVDGATSGQGASITIPETVQDLWVVVTKTAESNADNLLTVRLQAQVNSVWFDLAWDSIATTGTLNVATEPTADTTRKCNIVNVDNTAPTYSVIAHYKDVPTKTIRSIFVSSGTPAGANYSTFGVECYYKHKDAGMTTWGA